LLPLDWKTAVSHSLYWIEEGRKKTDMEDIDYERMVYFSLNHLLEWGKIDFKQFGDEEIMIASPYLKVADILNKYYEDILKNIEENFSSGIKSSHRTFLRRVILLSYTMHNLKTANKYFKYLKKHYPEEVGNLTISGYIAKQFYTTIREGSQKEIFDLLYGMLYQGFWYLGIGEEERYKGLESLANVIYKRTISEKPRFKNLFPTFAHLKKNVLEGAISSFPPPISKNLRRRFLH